MSEHGNILAVMKVDKVGLSSRVKLMTKELIALERRVRGGSEADALERLVLSASSSYEAVEIIRRHVDADPETSGLLKKYQQANQSKLANSTATALFPSNPAGAMLNDKPATTPPISSLRPGCFSKDKSPKPSTDILAATLVRRHVRKAK